MMMTNGHLAYSPDEIDAVAGWLREKLNGRDIAQRFSRTFRPISRSAIVGLIHRTPQLKAIGLRPPLKGRPAPKQEPGLAAGPRLHPGNIASKKASRALDVVFAPPVTAAEGRSFDAQSTRLPLDRLRERQCRWPVNHAERGEAHLFCGAPVERWLPGFSGGSYCAHHRLRMRGARVAEAA